MAGTQKTRNEEPEASNFPPLALRALGERAQAQTMAGSAVMTLIEKRSFLARVVRARIALLPEDSDLWQSVSHTSSGPFFRLPDKLQAIVEDTRLAGFDTEAAGYDSLAQWLATLRK